METPKPANKNRTVWIIVGVAAVLCLIACVVIFLVVGKMGSDMFNFNPSDVQAVSDKIAQYDMPPGYKPAMSMSIPSMYDMVALSDDSGTMIMFMQFTAQTGMSEQQMQEQMRQSFEQQSGQGGVPMQVVEMREDTIRGQKVTITISEGTGEGVTMRQWMTVFKGNGGPTVLMIQGATFNWDDTLITNFIHSIR